MYCIVYYHVLIYNYIIKYITILLKIIIKNPTFAVITPNENSTENSFVKFFSKVFTNFSNVHSSLCLDFGQRNNLSKILVSTESS